MKIGIVGVGNVGKALGTFLHAKHEVIGIDINKIDAKFPVFNRYDYLKDVDVIFIALPTAYLESSKSLDISLIEKSVDSILKINRNVPLFIKSTLGIGNTRKIINDNNYQNIFYTPEFLRQDHALEDIIHPTRLVIGALDKNNKYIDLYFSLFNEANKYPVSLEEAEAIKLFSNTYLAMRVAFFNELDTFANINHINTNIIIDAVSDDPRIGNYYNSPSYGYGGYCLPKDSKELASLYRNIPQKLIEAVVLSNDVRKSYIVKEILKLAINKKVGIYGNIKKYSPLEDIIISLKSHNVNIINNNSNYDSISFNNFVNEVDVILSEEKEIDISKFHNKLFVR